VAKINVRGLRADGSILVLSREKSRVNSLLNVRKGREGNVVGMIVFPECKEENPTSTNRVVVIGKIYQILLVEFICSI